MILSSTATLLLYILLIFHVLVLVCNVSSRVGKTSNAGKGDIFFFFFFSLPIIVSVACPTGAHPPLRLASRPNRGHIGGGGLDPLLRYMPVMFLSRVGSVLPPSSTVKSMHQGIIYRRNQEKSHMSVGTKSAEQRFAGDSRKRNTTVLAGMDVTLASQA